MWGQGRQTWAQDLEQGVQGQEVGLRKRLMQRGVPEGTWQGPWCWDVVGGALLFGARLSPPMGQRPSVMGSLAPKSTDWVLIKC